MKRIAKTALALLLALTLSVPAWALDQWDMGSDDYTFYKQLPDYAKTIYEEFLKPENLQCFRSGGDITISFDGPFERFNDTAQMLFEANAYAISAFELNHPEFFWLDGSANSASGSADRITLTVTPRFAVNWANGSRSTASDEAAVMAAVQAIADEAVLAGGPYQQLLYVHDWLTQHNVYNAAAAWQGPAGDYLPWTPLSALTEGLSPVCEGYAKAFQLVSRYLGYPCLLVDGWSNGGHSWNQVEVANAWYAVDVTYDDPSVTGVQSVRSGYENHNYFMVGADTFVNGQYFSDGHIPDGQRIAGVTFAIPELAPEALDPAFSWAPPDIPDEPEEPEYIRFADVDDTAYYAPAIRWAVEMGVTNGTGTDLQGNPLFAPGAVVTRGQAVTFLWRALWRPEAETDENPFADVSADAYYYDAVLWAVENGVTNGTGETTFDPDAPVTRGQMLTFLWRAVGRPMETPAYEGKPWYADAEGWANEFGIFGDTAYSYTAAADCPRCDVVYYLYHAMLSMVE